MLRMLQAHGNTLICAAAAAALYGCEQPAPRCNVAHGSFWARYELVSGKGACAELTGEQLDVQSYYAQRSRTDTRPDYDAVSIAIQPFSITSALGNAAGLAEPERDDVPWGIGRLGTSRPGADGFCRADKLAPASLRLPAVPEHPIDECTTAPEAPAYDLKYEFSRVRIYYTPSAIGTQFEADLTYTQDGCVARYRVSAVYPMVSCGAMPQVDTGAGSEPGLDAGASDAEVITSVEADGGVDCPAPSEPGPDPIADDSLCENAGINPDFALSCDPANLMCVLARSSPSLK